jgi:NADH-quinone oxidoreductase subunit M
VSELHLPWLELTVLVPALGAIGLLLVKRCQRSHWCSVVLSGLTLVCAVGAWQDFASLHKFEAHDHWDVLSWLFHRNLLIIDELSAPLLPLAALIGFLTLLATPRTKAQRFSFASALASEAILLATLCVRQPWLIVLL